MNGSVKQFARSWSILFSLTKNPYQSVTDLPRYILSSDIVGHKKVSYALIFNQQCRPDVLSLLKALHGSLENASDGAAYAFDHVIFCTNVTWKDTGYNEGALMPDLVL